MTHGSNIGRLAIAAGAATLAAIATCPPAHAQTVMGRDEIRATADCVVEQSHRQAADLFTTLPGSADERRAARHLKATFVACLGGDKHIAADDPAGVRAALAVALVVADASGTPRIGEPWYRSATVGKAAYTAYDPRRLGALEFGSCVMAAAPEAAVALVRAAPDSVAERRAVDALRPVIAPCMTHDTIVRLKADDLRSLLAEPVYHATVR
jgi:hypothetical protein